MRRATQRALRRSAAVIATGLAGAALLWPAAAAADDLHYADFRFGQRALGMGGAVIGFVAEPVAGYYNPGGLAFLGRTTFSGSVSYFGTDRRTVKRGGYFEGLDAVVGRQDSESSGLLTLPSSSALMKSLAGGRHVIGFSTYLVSDTRERFADRIDRDDQALGFDLDRAVDDRTTFMGPSYGVRLGEALGLGLSVFYARRQARSTSILAARFDTDDDRAFDGLWQFTESFNATDGMLLARIGAMWRPDPAWSLGLTVTTPAVWLHGEGTYSIRVIDTAPELFDEGDGPGLYEERYADEARSGYPLHVGLGAAWIGEDLTVALSGDLYLPVAYNRLGADAAEGETVDAVNRVERELTVNGALGVEYRITDAFPLRAGVFTNHSTVPGYTASDRARLPDVDLYGASLSIGYVSGGDAINLGGEVQLGRGTATRTFEETEVLDRAQLRVMIFLSGAVAFAKSTAGKVIREVMDEPGQP